MSFPFNPHQGLVKVEVKVTGPLGSSDLILGLDTGATSTVINAPLLVQLGYDPAADPNPARVTTASGVELVPRVKLQKITALGKERADFEVLCHALPPSLTVDGLVGLDFLQGTILTIDFRSGQITLS